MLTFILCLIVYFIIATVIVAIAINHIPEEDRIEYEKYKEMASRKH